MESVRSEGGMVMDRQRALPAPAVESTLFVVAAGTFATSLGNPLVLGALPMKTLLKERLDSTPTELALFFALSAGAFYVKPLFGLLLDRFSAGTRWARGLTWCAAAALLLWALLAVVPERYGILLALFTLLNLALAVASNILGGMMVREGNDRGATGRLGAASMASRHVGYLVAGPLGGFLAGYTLGPTAAIGGALMALLVVAVLLARGTARVAPAATLTAKDLRAAFASRPFWLAAAMIFLIELAPGFETPLFFLQRDQFGFSTTFLGWLQFAASVAGIIAAILFARLCRRHPLAVTLRAGIAVSAAASLLYYFYTGPVTAVIVTIIAGAAGTLAFLPALDLATRATPGGIACAGFALMMAARNISSGLSDLAGSWLNGIGVSFPHLIWVNSLSTLAVLLAVPLIPAFLLRGKDLVDDIRTE